LLLRIYSLANTGVEFTESELLRLSIGSRGRTQHMEPRLLVVARLLNFPLVL